MHLDDHFREVTKMVKLGSGAKREVEGSNRSKENGAVCQETSQK